ncbi:MAG: 16S rRNA (cytosine(1402)-N(4))-methyltransferase RsmH [Candidatus Promineifilaceae bacterium]
MHVPVLYKEVLEYLEPRSGSRFIDATVGAGGHSFGLLQGSEPDGFVLALDRDPEAIQMARQRLKRYEDRIALVNKSYDQMAIAARERGIEGVDGVLMDLGLSSMQLADSQRGFSFQADGPLDMRFDTNRGRTAADIVNLASREELILILRQYGEVTNSKQVADAMIKARPISTTGQLSELLSDMSKSRTKLHPATKVFQALRITVNDELETLQKGLDASLDVLKIGGRLAVISFHSLEDRIVKQFIKTHSQDCICPPEYPVCVCDAAPELRAMHRKVIRPSEEEIKNNPRSRSARMRVALKVAEVVS